MTNIDATGRVGLGLAALGRPVYITAGRDRDLGDRRTVAELARRTAEVLDVAYGAGIRYFDCARSYGLSERFLAAWLRSRDDLEEIQIASKWGYRYVGDWQAEAEVHEVKDHSVAAFHEQWAATRAELGGRVDIYQVHSVTTESPALHDHELLAALAGLRESGVRVGLSTSGPQQAAVVREASELRVAGEPLFTVVQSTWNLLEPSAGPALAAANQAGMDVVIKEALANGRLAPGGDDEHPAAMAAARLATELGVPLDQLALAAALHQPWVTRVLSGAVTPVQVLSNASAAAVVLPAEAVRDLLQQPEDPAAYWQQRGSRAWA